MSLASGPGERIVGRASRTDRCDAPGKRIRNGATLNPLETLKTTDLPSRADEAATTPPRPESPLRQRRRETTRLEIAEAAATLFLDQGFDATTVEQIATAAGVSLRTFYRYCDSKDDALVPVVVMGSDRFVDLIADAPDDRPLAEVVSASAVAVMEAQAHPHLRRDAVTIMLTTPALRQRWLGLIRDWQEGLTPVVATRFGWPPDGLQASALAALIASAVNSAVEHSLRTGEPLADSVEQSVGMLDAGVAAAERAARARR
jgi:AcrR family transcriptional regulator